MMDFKELKENILRKRPVCEICGQRQATQLHHCLVHDMKRYHKLLTVPENLMPVCEACHTELSQKANSFDIRVNFALRQIRLGYDITGWYRSLPLKDKESWLSDMSKNMLKSKERSAK